MNDNKYCIVSRIRDAYIKWDWEELSTNPKITLDEKNYHFSLVNFLSINLDYNPNKM